MNRKCIPVNLVIIGFVVLCISACSSPHEDIDISKRIFEIEINKEGDCESFHLSSAIDSPGGYTYAEYNRAGASPYELTKEESYSKSNYFFTSVNAIDLNYECFALGFDKGNKDSLVINIVGYFNQEEIGRARHVFYTYTKDEFDQMDIPTRTQNTLYRLSLKSFMEEK